MKKKTMNKGTVRSKTSMENYPHRRESDAMDLLLKLTHNKRMSTGGSDHISTISEKSTPCPSHEDSNQDLPPHEEWYEELSDDHSSAFKEVFDMLDSAHTGILNADTLFDGLKRVDSDITRQEVENVLKILDKDGNGEIDFDEFLMHITTIGSTEEDDGKSGSSKTSRYTKRQRLFFSALRKFNIKSDLCKLQAKKVEQPHVLSHYTAGVRLIGLTDKQLTIKLKRMQRAAKSIKSPYAKPLYFVIPCSDSQNKTVRKTIGLKTSHVLQEMDKKLYFDPLRHGKTGVEVEKEIQIFVAGAIRSQSKSKLFKMPKISEIMTLKKEDVRFAGKSKSEVKFRESEETKKSRARVYRRTQGWVIPRTERAKVPLPVLKLNGKRHRLTIEDLPDIREKVKHAVDMYYANLRKAFVRAACEHWEKLYAHHVGSKKLIEHFREVYRAYSPHKEEEAFVLCPWVPGAFRSVHNTRRHTAIGRDRVRSAELKHYHCERPYSAMY